MFKEINPAELKDNVFKLIGADWMLIGAGNSKAYNMMTASWGGLGVLWNKNVCFCFIRPGRYTYDFMENSVGFGLSFFGEEYREALNYCGSHSGRSENKALKTGLTPVFEDSKVYFEQARLVLLCDKLYFSDINPMNFIDKAIDANYPKKDYHRMYVGEIKKCLLRG
ncbi:MAG TPA: flavin reductase [Elusimicrobia bacterium]|nr:MAG: flavin reductase [Elusimicrobia bacterium RIFOXYA1_FULL_47_7]OGS10854.1 MAG: flavin reductase [Elusimicrobia bacterium RIFOXYB1_FULL_48_9]OGS15703.1 MAG: flavin reductase [Elusimicrobia bacterium RIFOXYA2_FULL_47_53]OGS27078.1 MAG: flavin reductase [Elusimicrobia bacterium RIFOXYB12_FULL_50_12]OGS31004.1 MAG: flavin reductase [Elusimicrobia bacterium RIFOXYB2_FULL_46_23]HBU70463.1 flavin reductase [Elusimicrobiota bacterium]